MVARADRRDSWSEHGPQGRDRSVDQELALTDWRTQLVGAESVAAAAEEQSVATDEVSSNIQGVRDANSETSQNTTAVNSAAREVLDYCEELNSKVGNFLTSVRAMV